MSKLTVKGIGSTAAGAVPVVPVPRDCTLRGEEILAGKAPRPHDCRARGRVGVVGAGLVARRVRHGGQPVGDGDVGGDRRLGSAGLRCGDGQRAGVCRPEGGPVDRRRPGAEQRRVGGAGLPARGSARARHHARARRAVRVGWRQRLDGRGVGPVGVGEITIDTTFGAPRFDAGRRERVVPAGRRAAGPERQRRRREESRGSPAIAATSAVRSRSEYEEIIRHQVGTAGRPTTSGRSGPRTGRSAGTAARPTAAARSPATARHDRRERRGPQRGRPHREVAAVGEARHRRQPDPLRVRDRRVRVRRHQLGRVADCDPDNELCGQHTYLDRILYTDATSAIADRNGPPYEIDFLRESDPLLDNSGDARPRRPHRRRRSRLRRRRRRPAAARRGQARRRAVVGHDPHVHRHRRSLRVQVRDRAVRQVAADAR